MRIKKSDDALKLFLDPSCAQMVLLFISFVIALWGRRSIFVVNFLARDKKGA